MEQMSALQYLGIFGLVGLVIALLVMAVGAMSGDMAPWVEENSPVIIPTVISFLCVLGIILMLLFNTPLLLNIMGSLAIVLIGAVLCRGFVYLIHLVMYHARDFQLPEWISK